MQEKLHQVVPLFLKYPSPIRVSVRLAQFALESGAGTSSLYRYSNNGFGIKASPPWKGQQVTYQGDTYRKYASLEESVKDHASFFTSTEKRRDTWYIKALQGTTAEEQARALTGVYAEDPHYGEKLVRIIRKYHLTKYDEKDQIIDRRHLALGGQRKDRPLSAIERIVWHYTAVPRSYRRRIEDHEAYWKNHHGWDRGGYHYYIDSDGLVYWNYNWERVTWGVAGNNQDTLHISCEASSAKDYSKAQVEAREALTRKLMKELCLSAESVFGHFEVNPNSACPGYSKQQMKAFRRKLMQQADPRLLLLPTYKKPKQAFRPLEVGDRVTIRPGFSYWLLPYEGQGYAPSKDFVGQEATIKKVLSVKHSYSLRAYLLQEFNSWILEQDVVEARVGEGAA